jgi:DNA-binding MarR family transcriptional regulator
MEGELNPILHQPIRTKIMAYLVTARKVDFTALKKALALTDGHMSTHMKLLVEENYVEVEKNFVDNKPKTTYRLSPKGKKAFADYVANLKQILSS